MAELKNYDEDPVRQFKLWFGHVQKNPVRRIAVNVLSLFDSTAAALLSGISMSLSTADKEGRPSSRMVLFKGIRDGKFLFYSNYMSQKGRDLAENPQVALTFYWLLPFPPRQVRVEGLAQRMSDQDSDLDWAKKPRQNQLVSYASEQSERVSEVELKRRAAELQKKFEGHPVPRPPHWGGYEITPIRIEFWRARWDRFFDRVNYVRKETNQWDKHELSP